MLRQGLVTISGTVYPIKEDLFGDINVQSNSVSYTITQNALTQLNAQNIGLSNGGILRPKDTILGYRNTGTFNYRIPTMTAKTGGADTEYLNNMQSMLQALELIIQLANTKRYPFSAHNFRFIGFGKFVPFATIESANISTGRMWHNISISFLVKEWTKLTLMSAVANPDIGEKIADDNSIFQESIGGAQ